MIPVFESGGTVGASGKRHDDAQPAYYATRPPQRCVKRAAERERETTGRAALTHRAPAFPRAMCGGSAPVRSAPAAVPEALSRSAPWWRRSGNNRPMPDSARRRSAAPAHASRRMRTGCGRMRAALAARGRPDACGRTQRPSEMPARTAPDARLIEFSIGTNSLTLRRCTPRPPGLPKFWTRESRTEACPEKTAKRRPAAIRANCVAFSTGDRPCSLRLTKS